MGSPGGGQDLDAPFWELAGVVVAAEMVDEHLLEGFVVGDEDVAGGASADEMAYLFSQILGMIAGALQGLGHEDDLQASLVGSVLRVFNVAEKDEVSQAIHLRICAQDLDGLGYVALRECMSAVGEHLFEQSRHARQLADILGIGASADGLGAVGEVEQVVADALEPDHEFHTGQQFTSFRWSNLRNEAGDSAIDLHVQGVKFALALAHGVEQGAGAGGDALRGGRSGLFGQVASLYGAAD